MDRIPYRDVRPTWANPATNMTARYLSHPDLRVAFIQVLDDWEYIYVVSDEPLPISTDDAVAMVEVWRMENG